MTRLYGILLVPFLLTGCGTVTVALGTTLSGSADTGEDASTTGGGTTGAGAEDSSGTTGGAASTGGSTGGTSTGGTTGGSTNVPVPTTCTPNADTYVNYAQAVLKADCASCHNGKFDTLAEVKSNAANQQSYIANGSMPPGGGLDSNEKARLVNWYLCKTP